MLEGQLFMEVQRLGGGYGPSINRGCDDSMEEKFVLNVSLQKF